MRYLRRGKIILLVLTVVLLQAGRQNALADVVKITLDESSETTVFRYASQRCSADDLPDVAARAYRDAGNNVILVASHYNTTLLEGHDLGSLIKHCEIVLKSTGSANETDHDDRSWIASTWTDDGRTVFAVVHDEYQAHRHPGKCKYRTYLECWYNTVLIRKSVDGGKSYQKLDGNKPILIADLPAADLQGKPSGFHGPSNIQKFNGRLYMFSHTLGSPRQPQGTCLVRQKDPDDWQHWEYLTASGFTPTVTPSDRFIPCMPIKNLHGSVYSLVRHSSGAFIAITIYPGTGAMKGNIAYSLSRDLINWSAPVSLTDRLPTPQTPGCGQFKYNYPSIIDPASPDRNFSDIGNSPKLFIVRTHYDTCNLTLERDLVRFDLNIAFL